MAKCGSWILLRQVFLRDRCRCWPLTPKIQNSWKFEKKTKHWRKGFTPSLNGNMWVPNLMTTTFFTWKVSAVTFDPKNSKWLKNWQNITQRRKGFKLSLYGNMWVPNLITTYIFTWKVPVLTFDPKIPKMAENLAKNFYIEGKALKEVYMVICGLWIYLRQALHMTGAGVDL